MPNRLMIQCTLANGQKGMISPTILKWKLDERPDAEPVVNRYGANPKHGETYAIVRWTGLVMSCRPSRLPPKAPDQWSVTSPP
jgi:hypothetical protein